MSHHRHNELPAIEREIPAWAQKPPRRKLPNPKDAMTARSDAGKARRVNARNIPVAIAAAKAEKRRVKFPPKRASRKAGEVRPIVGGTFNTGPMRVRLTEEQERAVRARKAVEVRSPYNPQAALAVEPLNETAHSRSFLQIDESQLPLALFDSDDFESHTPQEWLEIDNEGFAMYYDGRAWEWTTVDVLGYDDNVQKFKVRFHDSGDLKSVGRLGLRFKSEDKALFDARLDFVKDARERCKAAMRLEHFVKCMDTSKAHRLSQTQVKRIIRRSGVAVEALSMSQLKGVVAEVMKQYVDSVQRGSVFYKVAHDEKFSAEYLALRLPLPSPPAAAPHFGKLQIPGSSFEIAQAFVHENLITSKEVVVKLQQWLEARLW